MLQHGLRLGSVAPLGEEAAASDAAPPDVSDLAALGAVFRHVDGLLDRHATLVWRAHGGHHRHSSSLLDAHSGIGTALAELRKSSELLLEAGAAEGGQLALRGALRGLRGPVRKLRAGLWRIEAVLNGGDALTQALAEMRHHVRRHRQAASSAAAGAAEVKHARPPYEIDPEGAERHHRKVMRELRKDTKESRAMGRAARSRRLYWPPRRDPWGTPLHDVFKRMRSDELLSGRGKDGQRTRENRREEERDWQALKGMVRQQKELAKRLRRKRRSPADRGSSRQAVPLGANEAAALRRRERESEAAVAAEARSVARAAERTRKPRPIAQPLRPDSEETLAEPNRPEMLAPVPIPSAAEKDDEESSSEEVSEAGSMTEEEKEDSSEEEQRSAGRPLKIEEQEKLDPALQKAKGDAQLVVASWGIAQPLIDKNLGLYFKTAKLHKQHEQAVQLVRTKVEGISMVLENAAFFAPAEPSKFACAHRDGDNVGDAYTAGDQRDALDDRYHILLCPHFFTQADGSISLIREASHFVPNPASADPEGAATRLDSNGSLLNDDSLARFIASVSRELQA